MLRTVLYTPTVGPILGAFGLLIEITRPGIDAGAAQRSPPEIAGEGTKDAAQGCTAQGTGSNIAFRPGHIGAGAKREQCQGCKGEAGRMRSSWQ